MIFSFSRRLGAFQSWNDSAQSPAWSTNALPSTTSASRSRRLRASPAKTSGGILPISARISSRRAWSGQSGCWSAGKPRQEDGDQDAEVTATFRSVVSSLREAFASRRLFRFGYRLRLAHQEHAAHRVREPPVVLPEQHHQQRDEESPDQGGVDQHTGRQADAEL